MPHWDFELDDSAALGDLWGTLNDPDPDPDPELSYLIKALVDQFEGFSVHIYADEHPPPHFRVTYAGESADFTIDTCEQIAGGLKRYRRKIRAWHGRNRRRLVQAWNKRRPTDCPVGPIAER
jgi:hypothetical protein